MDEQDQSQIIKQQRERIEYLLTRLDKQYEQLQDIRSIPPQR